MSSTLLGLCRAWLAALLREMAHQRSISHAVCRYTALQIGNVDPQITLCYAFHVTKPMLVLVEKKIRRKEHTTMASIFTRSALPLALLSLILSACGTTQTTTAPAAAPTAASGSIMDPSMMSGTSTSGDATAPTAASGMGGMDHGTMAAADAPYDAAFIDGMIMHHDGAIMMANQALEQGERPEIKDVANAIISAQETEIGQMKDWRTAWYPALAETSGMAMDMGPMDVPAGDAPFDQRFLQAMIPHHQSAIVMARDALQKAEHQEIKDLANAIISAQEAEISQMQQWLKDWYGL